MKLVVQEFLTLDGVCQGPGSPDEDTSDGFTRGGWFVPHLDEAFDRVATGWLGQADAFLFGRRTYENFARDWPTMTDHPNAALLNGSPKYVASRSLTKAEWEPTTILAGDIPAQVAELKLQPGRELQIHGSARLGNALLSAGLVDTLRLVVAPTVIGSGRRLIAHPAEAVGLRLVRHDVTTTGLLLLEYETTGAAPVGTYEGVTAQ